MSYSIIIIKYLIIYYLAKGSLNPDMQRSPFYDACDKESDCNKTDYYDCFCLTPKCHCFQENETRLGSFMFNSSGMLYGEKCGGNRACRYNNCHKISQTCICYSEYHREGDLCVAGQLGYPCAIGCAFRAFCDATIGYKCTCYGAYYKLPNDSIKCHNKVYAGHVCRIDEACGTRALCKNYRCTCNYKEQYEEGGWCNPKVKLGSNCTKNDYCINNVCSDQKCVCPYGYQENHEICTRNLFNITCQTDNDCLERMNYTMCNVQKKLCTCDLKTYRKNEICIPKKLIGEICTENVECSYDYCKNSICKCRYGYYLFGEECTEGKKPGAECYLDEECQALNDHSSCVNRFCQCSPKFHLKKKKYCVPVLIGNTSCVFKIRIDMIRIVDTLQFLMMSWYQVSKDIEQKTREIFQTKLSDVFISISAYPGDHDGIIEGLIYLRIIIDDISSNLSEFLLDQLQLFEPIPFLPEPDDVKVIALEGICMNSKTMMSYEVKIGIIIATCLLLMVILAATGTIWHIKANDPKKYIPWFQKQFAKSVFIPPIEDLKEILHILIRDELVIQNTDKVLSYRELQAIYIRYFYYSYYDFDYSYIYDMSYPYETYMNTIEDVNYENSKFDELDYMASSNEDYYLFKEDYDNGYNYENVDKCKF